MTAETLSPAELRNMFGKNLRELSTQYPSVSELSRQLGINRTQFNRYLSGESFPRPDVLNRICTFFDVDARILLEPVATLSSRGQLLNGPVLRDFLGIGVTELTEELFPSGFYRFSRRSFLNDGQFLVGLVRVYRQAGFTYVRGFEAREAIRQQGLPMQARAREFRGYAARQEDGVAMVISRRGAMTCSFNFLARVASFENNYWVGYATRTVRETTNGLRAARMVYEHLASKPDVILPAARASGFKSAEELPPFHRRLLQTGDPFR